jgi:hypothetical protein
MMSRPRPQAIFGGMKKSMLDGELALIVARARRNLVRAVKHDERPRLPPKQPKILVLPEDGVWPTLRGYPYS